MLVALMLRLDTATAVHVAHTAAAHYVHMEQTID